MTPFEVMYISDVKTINNYYCFNNNLYSITIIIFKKFYANWKPKLPIEMEYQQEEDDSLASTSVKEDPFNWSPEIIIE